MVQRTSEKVSELPEVASTLLPTDFLPVVASGITKRVSPVYVHQVASMAALRVVQPVNGVFLRTAGYATPGDGGGGMWRGITGASPGTYTHDGGRVIVPSGGDGSACWLDADPQGDRSVLRWGVKADGVTDDTSALAVALTSAKTNGQSLVAPVGTIMIRELALGGGLKRWSLKGQGQGATIFKRISGGTSMNCGGSSVPFTLSDFTLDCNHSGNPTGSNHGISIGLMSGLRIERVSVIDHYASAFQVYDDAGTHRFFDNLIIDCSASGSGGLGQDGFLFANMDRCGLVRCYATGQNGSPGYGIQLKNVCHDSYITDCIADDCIALLAMGSDNPSPGVERCTVKGMTGTAGASTTAGYIGGRSQFNTFSDIAFDMNGGVGFAIRCQNDIGNTFRNVSIQNVGASRSAVYLDQASTDNDIDIGHIDNLNVTGSVVEFHANSLRNRVTLARMTNPLVRSAGLHTEATFNGTTTNYYSHLGQTMYENLTISAGAITPLNQATELIYLFGEGGAADSLDTVVTLGMQQNRFLRLRAGNPGSQPITITAAGNIATAGGAAFTLDGRTDTYSMMWVFDSSGLKFGELQRSNNG